MIWTFLTTMIITIPSKYGKKAGMQASLPVEVSYSYHPGLTTSNIRYLPMSQSIELGAYCRILDFGLYTKGHSIPLSLNGFRLKAPAKASLAQSILLCAWLHGSNHTPRYRHFSSLIPKIHTTLTGFMHPLHIFRI